jgi:hypothetical protein
MAFDAMSYYRGNQSGEVLGLLEARTSDGTGYY